jgi:hypothetical protein
LTVWTRPTASRRSNASPSSKLEVLDRAYKLSPLAPGALVPQPIDPGLD